MNAEMPIDAALSSIAIAIGEPARTRMMLALLDGYARTSTELAIAADVTASTASVHLNRLKQEKLVKVEAQGRHRYYSLGSVSVARALESLSVLAGRENRQFKPNTPEPLRYARTCYDHIAGTLSVLLHDHLINEGWLRRERTSTANAYEMSVEGERRLRQLGVEVDLASAARRKFAYGCLDWSERRFHLAGALGEAILNYGLANRWITRDLNSRVLYVTKQGKLGLHKKLGLTL